MSGAVTGIQSCPDARRWRLGRGAILFGILLASRLPYWNHSRPVHGDELEFVRAVGFPAEYPVHPPGYPLWVAMGTVLSWTCVEPYTAYACWSLLASILGPWLFYGGLAGIVAEPIAWWAALALGLSPLVWFLSTTALNYLAAMALGLGVISLCARAWITREIARPWLLTGLWVGTILMRPDYVLWLGPLLAVSLLRAKQRRTIGPAVMAAMGVAFVPIASWLAYGQAGTGRVEGTASLVWSTSVISLGLLDGLIRNAFKLLMNVAWHVGPGLSALAFTCVRWRPRREAQPASVDFVLMWTLPLVAFMLLVHMSEPGHVLLLAPVAYWLLAVELGRRASTRASMGVLTAVGLATILQFTCYPWSPESRGVKRVIDAKIGYVCGRGLMHIDRRGEIHSPGDYWPTAAHRKQLKGP